MPRSFHDTFVAPEQRITADMRERLLKLAPKFNITLKHIVIDGEEFVEFSGDGFSEDAPVTLKSGEATVRLLAEICSILTRWVPFSLWEPCEVTLFALPADRLERHANSFRKQLAQQQRREAREEAARQLRAIGIVGAPK